jgi:16S rRNA G966 N2-methylase RsmD
MKALIDEGFNLLPAHVFRFDFLNDKFDKLPPELKKIIDDPEKRKKLIIYINPPYAESASAHGTEGKKAVEQSWIHDKYALSMGHAQKELSAQFMARIYHEIPDCKIGEFSKLKILQSPRFKNFRNFFRARLMNCFVVHANTFDNVKGLFPIGFKVWDTETKKVFKYVDADVLDNGGKRIDKKRFWAYDDCKFINDWADTFREPFNVKDSIATLVGVANDFQQQNVVFFDKPYKKVIASNHNFQVTQKNLLPSAVYYSVRKCIPANWLNDRDQFLWPNDGWKNKTFQYDCLAYALFNTAIRSEDGGGNWIPFTEQEVDAKEKFESHFMIDFIKNIKFSREAKKVLNSGLELWKYYHLKIKGNNIVSVNASFYDIREYFQGRSPNGKMNNKSTDEIYNKIIKTLRNNVKLLAQKIEPKIYEYGFLK